MIFMLILGIVGAMGGAFASSPVFIVVVAALGFGLYKVIKSNMGQNEQQEMAVKMEEYERTWYCSKCANRFIW